MNTFDRLKHLEPTAIWKHFQRLCQIPRPSKHEEKICATLSSWAHCIGLTVTQDRAGNLLIRKPATPGRESCPGVILQGHLDMVCQKEETWTHDFLADPIQPELQDGWLKAVHTTLGADNGIGVAIALAVLENPTLQHGPLEVLLTVDEEAGMGGASALANNWLQGKYLINLDTEEWGKFYVGCAGGIDLEALYSLHPEPFPGEWHTLHLRLEGLQGGHSGLDIDKGGAHAIRELLNLLLHLGETCSFWIQRIEGGTTRNALPRTAGAILALSSAASAALAQQIPALRSALQSKFSTTDPLLNLSLTETNTIAYRQGIPPAHWQPLLKTLLNTPHGVLEYSTDFPGVVHTSNNLGVLQLTPHQCNARFLLRALDRQSRDNAAQAVINGLETGGWECQKLGAYPAWTPRMESPLLALCQKAFVQHYGQSADLEVIHAGLECGLLAEHYPTLDIISFGPNIRGAHAPGERVELASVIECWTFLTIVLAQLSDPERKTA